MTEFRFDGIGQTVSCRKTVSESDVYLFAGITGDFSPNHVDEQLMRGTRYGGRIAHGALIVGYMSRASTMIAEKLMSAAPSYYPVSMGYDKIRFLKAVFIGDTITVTYSIDGYAESERKSTARVNVTNDTGVVVAVARHIMKWLPVNGDG